MHTVIVVNNTDACVHVRMFRDEGGGQTTPPTTQHHLAPRERFSVLVAEHPKDVWVEADVMSDEADVMSDTDCANTKVGAYMAGYARGGGVIIAGRRPKYIFISLPIGDIPPQ